MVSLSIVWSQAMRYGTKTGIVGVKRLERDCKVIDANMNLFQLHLVELLKVLRILTPNETDLKLFLDILEESQGGLLRQLLLTKLFVI
jgi:hypothetical protein